MAQHHDEDDRAAAPRYPISDALLTASYCWVIICSAYALQILVARIGIWRRRNAGNDTAALHLEEDDDEEDVSHAVMDGTKKDNDIVRPIFRIIEEDDDPPPPPEGNRPRMQGLLQRLWYGLFFRQPIHADDDDAPAALHGDPIHNNTFTAVFVASYSLSGVFWFPQLSMLGGAFGCMLWHGRRLGNDYHHPSHGPTDCEVDDAPSPERRVRRRPRRRPLCHYVGLCLLVIAVSMLAVDLLSDPSEDEDEMIQDGSHIAQKVTRNLWLGGIVPCVVGWWSMTTTTTIASERARQPSSSPFAILTSAIPTLSFLSITYLTLHFPEQQQRLLLFKGRNATALPPLSANNLHGFLVNASRLYYELVVASPSASMGMATVDPPELSVTGAILFFATPSVIWMALAILLGSGMMMHPYAWHRAGSALGVYALATIVRRLAVDGRLTAAVCTALVVGKLGLGCVLHAEVRELDSCVRAMDAQQRQRNAHRLTSMLSS